MSKHPALDLCDDRDPIELAADDFDRPRRPADVEPVDFDDIRIAERHGLQSGGHFAFEDDAEIDDFGMEDWS
jgi:hypothetical protein